MTRVKRGIVSRKRHKKIIANNKGYRGAASVLFRIANQQNMKALRHAYRNRRLKKRNFRSLWVLRLNAALRLFGLNYSQFINYSKEKNILINRKILAQLFVCDPDAFTKLIKS